MKKREFPRVPKTINLKEKFGFALAGISYAWATQSNLRIHLPAALLVLLAAFLFRLHTGEFVLLLFCIFLVFLAEMLNTAIELAVDLFGPGQYRLAKAAKDVAAGAELLAALNAVIIGVLVFYPHILALWKR